MLPEAQILFKRFEYEAGTEAGARQRFQTFITDLVSLRYPAANEVADPGGGDWGIDTYVGALDEAIVVWQSKFFLDWKGEDQQGQVRDSFNQLIAKAKKHGFKIEAWTLCVPTILPPKEQKWFDGWAKRNRARHGVSRIDMWNAVALRKQLLQDDAESLHQLYFPKAPIETTAERVAQAKTLRNLDEALFVRQMEIAGMVETDAARGLFFAAEALARDLAVRGDPAKLAAFDELHLEIQTIWESSFNAGVSDGGADRRGRIAGLFDRVMREAANCADPQGLQLRPAHRRGITHRLVEDARAGWVSHWREIAAAHAGPSAKDSIAPELMVELEGAGDGSVEG